MGVAGDVLPGHPSGWRMTAISIQAASAPAFRCGRGSGRGEAEKLGFRCGPRLDGGAANFSVMWKPSRDRRDRNYDVPKVDVTYGAVIAGVTRDRCAVTAPADDDGAGGAGLTKWRCLAA